MNPSQKVLHEALKPKPTGAEVALGVLLLPTCIYAQAVTAAWLWHWFAVPAGLRPIGLASALRYFASSGCRADTPLPITATFSRGRGRSWFTV